MRPLGTRVLRRERRHAWRGQPVGRHARPVKTTYGRGQVLAVQVAEHSAFCAERRALLGEDGADD
jgi:hypothetical protein